MPCYPGFITRKKIGWGSFGEVYEIENNYGEKAALKVISIPRDESDTEKLLDEGYDNKSIYKRYEDYKEKVIDEYAHMAHLKGCTNIVHCEGISINQHEDRIGWDILIKMELLTPLMKSLGSSISEETVIRIGKDICTALTFCEQNNIIHRDIKPENIFVAQDGTYKLGDFGIAKEMSESIGTAKIGTYQYMAPEVFNNERYATRADVYSLGLALYWLLNEKRTPFLPLPPEMPTDSQEKEAQNKRFTGTKIPKPLYGSRRLQNIVLKACSFRPEDRYVSAEEMLKDLNALAVDDWGHLIMDLSDEHGNKSGRTGGTQGVFGEGEADGVKKSSGHHTWIWFSVIFALILLLFVGYHTIHFCTDPTCTEPAICKICHKVQKNALGHNWGIPEYMWSSDYSMVTATALCKNDPSHKEMETVRTTSTIYKQPTCEERGITIYSAAFQSEAFKTQVQTVANLPALGHTWIPATYVAPQTCSRCGKTQGVSLVDTDHSSSQSHTMTMGPFTTGRFYFVNGASLLIPSGFVDTNTTGDYRSQSVRGGYNYVFHDSINEMYIELSEAKLSAYIDTGKYGRTGEEMLSAYYNELISLKGEPAHKYLKTDRFRITGYSGSSIYYTYVILVKDTIYVIDYLYPTSARSDCDRIVETTEASFVGTY